MVFSLPSSSSLMKKIDDNPISSLQEYCVSVKLPFPEYTDSLNDTGGFSFKTVCTVNENVTEGKYVCACAPMCTIQLHVSVNVIANTYLFVFFIDT